MRSKTSWFGSLAFAATFAWTGAVAAAPVEVQWWHAMGGELGKTVERIAQGFNESQDAYKVTPVYKGNYTETMTAAISAFRAQEHPHIVQVFEVGTATMMAAEGAVYPVHKLMADAGEPFEKGDYIPAVVSYYTTPEGKLLSLPFNSSTPVLWRNKDAFREAGLDPDRPPQTWSEMESYSEKLQDAGYPCGFSIGWQSWVAIENFSAWHNIPIGTKQNGFAGLETGFAFNNDLVTRHISDLAEWQRSKIFDYGGRRGESLPKFTNAECAMWINSSAYYASIREQAQFEFGQSFLPYYEGVDDAPQNSIIGGATLWVLRGHSDEEYKGVAKFFSYLSQSEVQFDWHESTGYVPITTAAYELAKQKGHYERNPGTDTAIKQLSLHAPTPNSKGLRFGNFVQIRDVINEELEAVWAGEESAMEALGDAVERGNRLLRQFEDANS